MKYIKLICLFLISIISLQAQSNLKGILQTEFSNLEKENEYTNTLKKWGLQEVPTFENNDCNRSGIVDISFLVDATSSMSDQIDFLKSEMNNMILEVQKSSDIQFRTSAVFYRDQEEEYQVKSSNFVSETSKTLQFINNQKAAGGGDYPEDFALGFTKAVALDWNSNADAKLLFLFCDAPPHDHPESIKAIQEAYKVAAKKGITIFPIIGTAADLDTELIMKTLAKQSRGASISLQKESDPAFNQAGFLVDLIPNILSKYGELENCDPEEFIASEVFVYGNTFDALSKEKLALVNLTIYKNGVFHSGKSSDFNGFYNLELEPGFYDFKFSFTGFQDKTISNVEIGKEEELELNGDLKMGIDLETVVITEYKLSCFQDIISCGGRVGCSSNCFQKSNKEQENPSSTIVDKKLSSNSTSLYPNPANTYTNVSAKKAFKTIQVFSSDGKLIFQQDRINDVQLELQVSDWSAGLYLVYYFFEDGMEVEKLIIGRE